MLFFCPLPAAWLPGYPHKITILSDCILWLCRAGCCFWILPFRRPSRVAPSCLRLISICCRAKFMTVISKRRAANTFLMPHASWRGCRVFARFFRELPVGNPMNIASSEPQLLLPYAILLPACATCRARWQCLLAPDKFHCNLSNLVVCTWRSHCVRLWPWCSATPHLVLLPRVVAFVVYAFASIVADLDCLLLQFPFPFRVHFVPYLFSCLACLG